MTIKEIFRLVVLLFFLIWASVIDKRSRVIPNWITFPMIILGIIQSIIFGLDWWPEILIAVVLLFILSAFTGIGMGDAKLLLGMCCWIRPVYVLYIFALAAIGVVSKYLTDCWRNQKPVACWPTKDSLKEKKTPENSVAFAPELLESTIIIIVIEGMFFLCNSL